MYGEEIVKGQSKIFKKYVSSELYTPWLYKKFEEGKAVKNLKSS
jgi:hypothetical protein